MDDKDIYKIAESTKIEINHKIDEFLQKLKDGTKDPDSFMTLSEIEKEWSELNLNTTNLYSKLISSYISSIDEKDLIKSKKENTEERGSD